MQRKSHPRRDPKCIRKNTEVKGDKIKLMITPELVDFFESVIESWTPKQKIIAQDLVVNKTYQIIKIYDNRQPKLYLRNINNGIVVDLEKHVKSKCNC
jgi:hypothetical protein